MAKTLVRFNRQPRGTRAKVDRIIKDLHATTHPRHSLDGASGARLFAVWMSNRR